MLGTETPWAREMGRLGLAPREAGAAAEAVLAFLRPRLGEGTFETVRRALGVPGGEPRAEPEPRSTPWRILHRAARSLPGDDGLAVELVVVLRAAGLTTWQVRPFLRHLEEHLAAHRVTLSLDLSALGAEGAWLLAPRLPALVRHRHPPVLHSRR